MEAMRDGAGIQLRWFWNDGGPLLVLPSAAESAWGGSDPPSGGRVVDAKFRWNEPDAPATDYDRACDLVSAESAAALHIGESWGVLLGTAVAQSAAWLPGRVPDAFFAVGVEAADDVSSGRLTELVESVDPAAWRPLMADAQVSEQGVLILHAACRAAAVREYTPVHEDSDQREGVLIGDALRFPARAGRYVVDVADVVSPNGEYLTFVRFARKSGGL